MGVVMVVYLTAAVLAFPQIADGGCMPNETIQFNDGAAYERYMGVWSQRAGAAFLDWLAAPAGLRWLDVGCGNGAFTEMLLARCAPERVTGIDPSEGQLAYARSRLAPPRAQFRQGDAMAVPFADDAFDAAVMPLVIFFVPEPAQGVAEMVRVVRPGGIVAAYAWDMPGGGFPYEIVRAELRSMNRDFRTEPRPEASRLDVMQSLWSNAGLDDVETHALTVHRTFADFDDYWTTIQGGPSFGPTLAALSPANREQLKARLRDQLPLEADGGMTLSARANAVKGRVRA
jgi:SAM-dependent methyltransferase